MLQMRRDECEGNGENPQLEPTREWFESTRKVNIWIWALDANNGQRWFVGISISREIGDILGVEDILVYNNRLNCLKEPLAQRKNLAKIKF